MYKATLRHMGDQYDFPHCSVAICLSVSLGTYLLCLKNPTLLRSVLEGESLS